MMLAEPARETRGMHVLIVDDHPLLIRGMQALLMELEPAATTAGARSVEEAVQKANDRMPDLVLLDLNLPGMKDLDSLKRMRAAISSVPIVVVSADDRAECVWKAIEMDAAGYIPKDTDPLLMTQALRLVLARGVYIPVHALRNSTAEIHEADRSRGLSDAEISVLRRLLQGKSNKVIARDLKLSESTVKSHLTSIFEKLGVDTRLQAMARAHELRLVDKFGLVD